MIAAVVGDSERHCFFAGTCCLREDNELHLLEFDEESNTLGCVAVYRHPKEIWSISPSPRDSQTLFTCYNTGPKFQASLWHTGGDEDDAGDDDGGDAKRASSVSSHGGQPLRELAQLPEHDSYIRSCVLLNLFSISCWNAGAISVCALPSLAVAATCRVTACRMSRLAPRTRVRIECCTAQTRVHVV